MDNQIQTPTLTSTPNLSSSSTLTSTPSLSPSLSSTPSLIIINDNFESKHECIVNEKTPDCNPVITGHILREGNAPRLSCLIHNLVHIDGTLFYVSKNHSTMPIVRLNTRHYWSDSFEYDNSMLRGYLHITPEKFNELQKINKCNCIIHKELRIIFARIGFGHNGHFIVDNVVPLIQLLMNFNLLGERNSFLYASDNNEIQRTDNWFKIISNQGLQKPLCNSCCCIFERSVIGLGGLGWYIDESNVNSRLPAYNTFHKIAIENMLLPWIKLNNRLKIFEPNQFPLRIDLIQRKSPIFCNCSQIKQLIESIANKSQIQVIVNIHELENMSLEEQSTLFYNMSIGIGIDGAAFDNIIYSKPQTGFILFSRDSIDLPGFISFNHNASICSEGPAKYFSLWEKRGHHIETLFTTGKDCRIFDTEQFTQSLNRIFNSLLYSKH
eukprot:TRINITY_DN2363_c0_g2_i2.p1 TRINITY_DN2363_c0_g2~~TRINITY_DN2363_c0_g2_i2.p1  ORF type:complete len:438 (+),score=145.26 TRINITY_DN2363_c0_g2_i2:84-1397(+)